MFPSRQLRNVSAHSSGMKYSRVSGANVKQRFANNAEKRKTPVDRASARHLLLAVCAAALIPFPTARKAFAFGARYITPYAFAQRSFKNSISSTFAETVLTFARSPATLLYSLTNSSSSSGVRFE